MLCGDRTAKKWQRLQGLLKKEDKVAILMYGEPDPDSLSSAWALKELLTGKVEMVELIALAPIRRQQNLLFAKKLKIPFSTQPEVK